MTDESSDTDKTNNNFLNGYSNICNVFPDKIFFKDPFDHSRKFRISLEFTSYSRIIYNMSIHTMNFDSSTFLGISGHQWFEKRD